MHGNLTLLLEELRATPGYSEFIVQDAISQIDKKITFKTINYVTVMIYLHSHSFYWNDNKGEQTHIKVGSLSGIKFDFDNELITFRLKDKDFLAMKI